MTGGGRAVGEDRFAKRSEQGFAVIKKDSALYKGKGALQEVVKMADVTVENAHGERRAGRLTAQWIHNDGPMRMWRYIVVRMRIDPGDPDDLDEMLDDLDEKYETT